MLRFLLPAALLALSATACASLEGTQPDPSTRADDADAESPKPEPQPEPQPQPEPAATTTFVVASVTMVQDCPDPAPPAAPATSVAPSPGVTAQGASTQPSSAKRRPGPGGGPGFAPQCTQSMMQLSFDHEGPATKVEVTSVRLVRPDTGAVLATIDARGPTAWNDEGSYVAWDEVLGADTQTKASYKISVPDWSAVDRALGVSSFDHMFALDVEVRIDGKTQTARSPEFTRERPHVIVT